MSNSVTELLRRAWRQTNIYEVVVNLGHIPDNYGTSIVVRIEDKSNTFNPREGLTNIRPLEIIMRPTLSQALLVNQH